MVQNNRRKNFLRKYEKYQEQDLPKIKISEGIVLAAIPIIAYMILYCVEWGYFNYYLLPVQFISFDIAEIFVAITGLIITLFLGLFLLNLGYPFEGKLIPRTIVKAFTPAIPFYIFLLTLIYFLSETQQESDFYSIVFIGYTLYIIITLIYKRFIKKESLDTNGNNQTTNSEYQGPLLSRILNALNSMFGKYAGRILVNLVFLLFVAYQYGWSQAYNKKDYWFVNTTPESIVLYVNSDEAIISPFDKNLPEIAPIYRVVYYSDNQSLEYSLKRIGQLHIKSITPIPTFIPTPTDTPVPTNTLSSTATTIP
jgi:hypothetical protein